MTMLETVKSIAVGYMKNSHILLAAVNLHPGTVWNLTGLGYFLSGSTKCLYKKYAKYSGHGELRPT